MEKHNFILKKVSRLFPSSFTSCQFRSLPDVAETSISIAKPNKILHENDRASFFFEPSKINPLLPKLPEKHTSSSHSAWFTSSDEKTRAADDETDAVFSMSSNSGGDSFRLKTTNSSQRFRSCGEMKSIDETGLKTDSFSSFSSLHSRRLTAAAAKTCEKLKPKRCSKSSKAFPEYELGSDHISTQIYYNNNDNDSRESFRRWKTSKTRRKTKKSRGLKYSSVIGESYAVEKSSNDPRGDFRASMVEMIVEKQMFGAEDLERLLLSFLSLNVARYHGIIYDVFSEICQTLFSN